ncbi:MAG: CoA transferase [Chloroflexota bacterium]|nr:MAG: CoA transferase [Chloroflexota bacterium]
MTSEGTSAGTRGALDGIRVVDFTEFAFMPSVAAILGDWGADVIKIEHPTRGDGTRGLLSVGAIPTGAWNYSWELNNRNKRGIGIDASQKQGQEIIRRLVEEADVFTVSLRQSALCKYGLDYETLRKANPRLIYVHGSGYGEEGDERERPGYDIAAYWARSGIMASLAGEGQTPPFVPVGMGDLSASLALAGGIGLALYARERTGLGQKVSLSLLGMGIWGCAVPLQSVIATGAEYPFHDRKRAVNPLWNTYRAKDGKWLVLASFQSDRYWPGFCRALERPDLERDPRFIDVPTRAANNVELITILDDVFATRDRDEWGKRLDSEEVIWGPAQTFPEVMNDPQVLANGYLTDVDHPALGPIRLVRNPIELSEMPPVVSRTAPELGQHTEEILMEVGYDWDDIIRLKEEEIVN